MPYKGYCIFPRTFQVRGSGRWTLDLVITRGRGCRSFSTQTTYPTEVIATARCFSLGQRIIDGVVPGRSVADLF